MKKVLFPLMAVVLALALAVPMAVPVAAADTPMYIVSDTDVMVTAGNTGGGYPHNAVEAWQPFDVAVGPAPAHQYWDYYTDYDFSSSLLGAKWIWESERVVNPIAGDVVEFERTFSIAGSPTAGELRITCDNGYEAYLNGDLVASGQVHDYDTTEWENSDLTENWVNCNDWTMVEVEDVTTYLVPGVNVLHIIAANEYMDTDDLYNRRTGDTYYNPAGLIFELELAYEATEDGGCVGTPGYWKNHPEAWPVDEITIGGVTYTKAAAIAYMDTAVKGDKTYSMFSQLVSAKLGVINGADPSCIEGTITAADEWMATYGPVGSGVRASSAEWLLGGGALLHAKLSLYNRGLMCCTVHC